MIQRSQVHAVLLSVLLATAALSIACSDASVNRGPDGVPEIKVTGDDQQTIEARGLENSVTKAEEARARAVEGGNPSYVADWDKIIERLKNLKDSKYSEDLESLAEENGWTQTDDGTWVWNGDSDEG